MPPQNKENRRRGRSDPEDDGTEEYRKKRDKNNLAVQRSRAKTKQRTKQTLDRVVQLKSENETLEEKIRLLTQELTFLKNLFLAHAGSSGGATSSLDLESLLQEDHEASSVAIRNLMNDPNFKLSK